MAGMHIVHPRFFVGKFAKKRGIATALSFKMK